jgi:hypothetical protein
MSKTKTEFTNRANIVFAIVEVLLVPTALFFLFMRMEAVYSATPAPIGDNFFTYWRADMIEHFWLYFGVGLYLLLWAIGRSWRIIDSRRQEREQRMGTKSMTELLEGIQSTLNRIENKLGDSKNDKSHL